MNYVKRLTALADKLEKKMAQVVTQMGTTELFFGDEGKQRAFNQAISNADGSIAKMLLNQANKSQKTASFDLKANAEPGKRAQWILKVNPLALHGAVTKLLDAEFQKIMGQNMNARAKEADVGAKKGGGSGVLDIGKVEYEF